MTKNVIDALFPATQTSKNPSERTDTYWLTQYSPNATAYTDEWCGSWYIDVTEKSVNKAWKKILNSCLDNELFYVKCTTARVSGKGKKFPKFLIRVFTKDWRDIQELVRVRQKLMELGFKKPLRYKREVDFLNKVSGEREYYIDEKKDGLFNNVKQVIF